MPKARGISKKLSQNLPQNLVGVLLFGFLWLLEVSWLSSVLVLIVVVVLMQFGRALGASAGFGEVGIGTGIVLGIGVLVFSGQLLLLLGMPAHLAHWTIVIVMGVIAVSLRKKSLMTPTESMWKLSGEVFFCLAIALLVMAVRHPWLLSFAIPVFVLERYHQSTSPHRNYIVLLVGAAATGWIIAQQLRPDRWWYYYQPSDAGFFESLSWSIAQWGVWEHPGNVGGSIANYHWLSYAFFGQLSQLAFLGPWDALMKIGQPIMLLAVASSLMTHPLKKERISTPTSFCWSAALLIAAAWLRVDSDSFGLMTGLVLITLTLRTLDNIRPTTSTSLVLFLASATVTLSKATTGLVVGALILLLTLIQWRHQGQFTLRPLVSFATAATIVYLVFFRGSRAEATLASVKWNPGRLIDEVILHPLAGIALVLVVVISVNRQAAPTLSNHGVLAVATTFLISLCITPMLANSDLFTGSSIFFFTSIAVWKIYEIACNLRSETTTAMQAKQPIRSIYALPILISVGSFAYPVALNRLDRLANIRGSVGDSIWQTLSGLLPYSLVLLLIIVIGWRTKPNWRSFSLSLLAVVTILALITGLSLDRARRIATWGPSVYTTSIFNDSPFPGDSSRRVSQYIRNNTSPSIVLAANDFCCFGVTWWDKIREDLAVATSNSWDTAVSSEWWQTLKESPWGQRLADDNKSFISEDKLFQQLSGIRWGGDNYHLSAESRRRFLLLGLKFQTGGVGGPTSDQLRRMTVSLQFANSPSRTVAEDLKGFGASGYVVNLSLTNHRDWSEFAIEKFRDGNFVYLELKQ